MAAQFSVGVLNPFTMRSEVEVRWTKDVYNACLHVVKCVIRFSWKYKTSANRFYPYVKNKNSHVGLMGNWFQWGGLHHTSHLFGVVNPLHSRIPHLNNYEKTNNDQPSTYRSFTVFRSWHLVYLKMLTVPTINIFLALHCFVTKLPI